MTTTPLIQLRPYQQEAVQRIVTAYQQTPKGGQEYLVLPTGAGKTIVFCSAAEIIRQRYGVRVLIVAHRDELLNQAIEKYRLVQPDPLVTIGKLGSGCSQYGGQITVASIQTLARRIHLDRLNRAGGPPGFVIVDETHHVEAQSYQRLLHELGPHAFILGVTATPERLDGKPIFGQKDKQPLMTVTIPELIAGGYLVNARTIAIQTQTDLSGVRLEHGDFVLSELESAVDTDERNALIVRKYQEYARGRRAICFATTVAHAMHLARAFENEGIRAAVISGATPLPDRQAVYQAFRQGTISVICSVMVLSEGFDEPLAEVAICARPSRSRALILQQVGRVLRPAPGKTEALWLDLSDNCKQIKARPLRVQDAVAPELEIQDGESLLEAVERKAEELQACQHPIIRRLKERRLKDEEIQLFVSQAIPWEEQPNGVFVSRAGPHRIGLVPKKGTTGLYEVWAKLAPDYRPQRWLEASPLDWATYFAEQQIRRLLTSSQELVLLDRQAAWRHKPATPNQISWLKRRHIPFDDEITRGQAADLIDAWKRRKELQELKKQQRRCCRKSKT